MPPGSRQLDPGAAPGCYTRGMKLLMRLLLSACLLVTHTGGPLLAAPAKAPAQAEASTPCHDQADQPDTLQRTCENHCAAQPMLAQIVLLPATRPPMTPFEPAEPAPRRGETSLPWRPPARA